MCWHTTTPAARGQGELGKVRFWTARFTRLYPIYLLSLLIGLQTLPGEFGVHTHFLFWAGVVLTPLLLQGWVPEIATFWNTPAWTMSAESFFYLLFPWLAKWKQPQRICSLLARMGGVWLLGMIPGAVYMLLKPDGIAHIDRWSWAHGCRHLNSLRCRIWRALSSASCWRIWMK